MGFCRITNVCITVLLLTLLFVVGNVAAGGTCPGPNKVPHRDGTYDFTYESWITKYENRDHWDFGRCVENRLSTLEMFVDWKNTGVSGWAKPKDKVDTGIESLGSDYDLLHTDMWYGAGPSSIDAPYREIKPGKKVSPGALLSRVHMAVPENSKRTAETLVSIEVEFASDVWPESNGFKYSYRWSDALAKDRSPVRFRWKSLATVFSAVGSRQPERLQMSIDKSEVSFVSKAPPAYDVTLVEFLDRDGEIVVGTAPIAIYHPADVNVPTLPAYDQNK